VPSTVGLGTSYIYVCWLSIEEILSQFFTKLSQKFWVCGNRILQSFVKISEHLKNLNMDIFFCALDNELAVKIFQVLKLLCD
jgi:hypothetical protein